MFLLLVDMYHQVSLSRGETCPSRRHLSISSCVSQYICIAIAAVDFYYLLKAGNMLCQWQSLPYTNLNCRKTAVPHYAPYFSCTWDSLSCVHRLVGWLLVFVFYTKINLVVFCWAALRVRLYLFNATSPSIDQFMPSTRLPKKTYPSLGCTLVLHFSRFQMYQNVVSAAIVLSNSNISVNWVVFQSTSYLVSTNHQYNVATLVCHLVSVVYGTIV